jgi:YggT family protein
VGLILTLIQTALTVYIFIIVGRFLLSWVPLRSGTFAYRVYSVLYDATEPYLRIFRPLIPPVRLGDVALDLSSMAAVAVLMLASFVVGAL